MIVAGIRLPRLLLCASHPTADSIRLWRILDMVKYAAGAGLLHPVWCLSCDVLVVQKMLRMVGSKVLKAGELVVRYANYARRECELVMASAFMQRVEPSYVWRAWSKNGPASHRYCRLSTWAVDSAAQEMERAVARCPLRKCDGFVIRLNKERRDAFPNAGSSILRVLADDAGGDDHRVTGQLTLRDGTTALHSRKQELRNSGMETQVTTRPERGEREDSANATGSRHLDIESL
jgi:hypothetical protein